MFNDFATAQRKVFQQKGHENRLLRFIPSISCRSIFVHLCGFSSSIRLFLVLEEKDEEINLGPATRTRTKKSDSLFQTTVMLRLFKKNLFWFTLRKVSNLEGVMKVDPF